MEFKGASYIPFIKDNGQIYIMLFKSNRVVYCDLGGHRENGETPEDTCKREVNEESLNTLNVNLEKSKKVFFKGYYCFFENININFNRFNSTYINNKKLLDEMELPDHWKETIKVDLFPLSSFTNVMNEHKSVYLCKDAWGNEKKVWFRVIKYIKHAIMENILYFENGFIKNDLEEKKIIKIDKNFNNLNNTITIFI